MLSNTPKIQPASPSPSGRGRVRVRSILNRALIPHLLVSLSPCLLVLFPGCRSAHVATTMPASMMTDAPDSQMDFWHTLPDHHIVANDEAFHALLLFLDGSDPAADYDARVQLLKDRHLLAKNFGEPADQAVHRGTLAVALIQALNIKGGLTLRLTGPTERYATRELQWMGLFPTSSPQQTFSGQEILGIIGRAEDFQRTQEHAAQPKAHEEPSIQEIVAPSVATQPASTEPATQPTAEPFNTPATNPPLKKPATPAPGTPVQE